MEKKKIFVRRSYKTTKKGSVNCLNKSFDFGLLTFITPKDDFLYFFLLIV